MDRETVDLLVEAKQLLLTRAKYDPDCKLLIARIDTKLLQDAMLVANAKTGFVPITS